MNQLYMVYIQMLGYSTLTCSERLLQPATSSKTKTMYTGEH